MNEFIEIHLHPKGEAMIIRKSAIESLWASPNEGNFMNLHGRTGLLHVSDSYEDIKKKLIGEGEA